MVARPPQREAQLRERDLGDTEQGNAEGADHTVHRGVDAERVGRRLALHHRAGNERDPREHLVAAQHAGVEGFLEEEPRHIDAQQHALMGAGAERRQAGPAQVLGRVRDHRRRIEGERPRERAEGEIPQHQAIGAVGAAVELAHRPLGQPLLDVAIPPAEVDRDPDQHGECDEDDERWFSVHTRNRVEPGRYSQRNTTLERNCWKLKPPGSAATAGSS